MMGIKTSTVKLNKDRDQEEKKKLRDNIGSSIGNKDDHSDSIFPKEFDYSSDSHKMYIDKKWYTLTPKFDIANLGVIERLDVSILQDNVLAPMLGIDDPRTSKAIDFIGGIRGTAELEKLVNSGDFAVAFSMYPTTVGQLIDIADAGEIMPPKSTWFEPKLRDGLVCHNF